MQMLFDRPDVNSCTGERKEHLTQFSSKQDAYEAMTGQAVKDAFRVYRRSCFLTRLNSCVSQDPAGDQSSRDALLSQLLQVREFRVVGACKVHHTEPPPFRVNRLCASVAKKWPSAIPVQIIREIV